MVTWADLTYEEKSSISAFSKQNVSQKSMTIHIDHSIRAVLNFIINDGASNKRKNFGSFCYFTTEKRVFRIQQLR